MSFLPLENYDHVVVATSNDFPSNLQRDVPFNRIAHGHSRADWNGIRGHLRDVPWEDIFKLSDSATGSEWVKFGTDVYIPHWKYQVNINSSPWCSGACTPGIVHRNPFFHFYQQNKSSESKVKLKQASNHCKSVLESVKVAYANKTKEFISS